MIKWNKNPVSIFDSPFLIDEKTAFIIFIIFCIVLILFMLTQGGFIFRRRPTLIKWVLGIILVICSLFFSGSYGLSY